MQEINEKFSNSWISVLELVDKEKDINGYYYLHEKRCNGIIVALLPYRFDENGDVSCLIRSEFTPCWSTIENKNSSITGGFNHSTTLETAKTELKEEAGFNINEDELIDLGTCYGTKSSDTVYYLYAVDLTNKDPEELTTNDPLENKAYNYWILGKALLKINIIDDPILAMLIIRLYSQLKNQGV